MYRVLDGNGVSLMTSLDSLAEPFVVVTEEALYGEYNTTANFLRTEIDKAAGQHLGEERAAAWKPKLKGDNKVYAVLINDFKVFKVAPGTSWRDITLPTEPPGHCDYNKVVLQDDKAYPAASFDAAADEDTKLLVAYGRAYTITSLPEIEPEWREYLIIDVLDDTICAKELPAPEQALKAKGAVKMFKVLLDKFELYDVAPGTSWKETLLMQASVYRAPCTRKFVLTEGKAYPCCSTNDFLVGADARILVVRGEVFCAREDYVPEEWRSEYLVIDMATNKIVAQKGLEGSPLPAETPAPPNVLRKLVEGKLRHDCVPPIALVALAEAMQNGADKYGKFNWRSTGVSRANYYAAMMRHLLAWANGEEVAPDSGVSHLGHIMANCAILLDGPQVE